MSEHLFLYRIKDSDDRDCCAYVDAAGPKFECNHYFSSINICGSCYFGGSSLSMKKLKQFSQKMNMKKLFHSIYLSKHLIMALQRVTVDTEQGLNLLILLNISMIN